MSKLKTQLTSEVAGIVLEYVKAKKGRLTWISEVTGINRREFNRHGLAKMKFHRLLRILYALSLCMDEEVFKEFMTEISDTILDYADAYDECLLTNADE